MGMESTTERMEANTKDNELTINCTEKGFTPGMMEEDMKENERTE